MCHNVTITHVFNEFSVTPYIVVYMIPLVV
nr:MAG TPA: hypothetical protein [Caudoviricetes sp.]DAQ91915.1 MAG TPA: hypothetical protein [Caudoviricetes sp.]